MTLRPEKIRIAASGAAVAPGDFATEGRVADVVYLGAQKRFVVALDTGLEVAIVEQNLEKTASSALAEKGRQVQLVWPVDAPRAVSTAEGSNRNESETTTEGEGNA